MLGRSVVVGGVREIISKRRYATFAVINYPSKLVLLESFPCDTCRAARRLTQYRALSLLRTILCNDLICPLKFIEKFSEISLEPHEQT